MKTFKVQIPKGYEIDRGNSTFERVAFKPIMDELALPRNPRHFCADFVSSTDLKDYFNGMGLTADTATGMELIEAQRYAIGQCRKILDTLRDGFIPAWGDSSQYKYWAFFDHRCDGFFVTLNKSVQELPDFWYLASKNKAEEFLETVDHNELYLALYGKRRET